MAGPRPFDSHETTPKQRNESDGVKKSNERAGSPGRQQGRARAGNTDRGVTGHRGLWCSGSVGGRLFRRLFGPASQVQFLIPLGQFLKQKLGIFAPGPDLGELQAPRPRFDHDDHDCRHDEGPAGQGNSYDSNLNFDNWIGLF